MKRVWAVLAVGLLFVLASCPVDPTDPGTSDTGTGDTDGTPGAPIDLGVVHYDDMERSVDGRFPGSSAEAHYRLHIDGSGMCAVKTQYRLEVRLVPPKCLDYYLELHDGSSDKLALLAVSDNIRCDEEKIKYEWVGTCENNDSRDFLIVVAALDRAISPSASVSASADPFTLYFKPLKVRATK